LPHKIRKKGILIRGNLDENHVPIDCRAYIEKLEKKKKKGAVGETLPRETAVGERRRDEAVRESEREERP
jgi:hypothetical protein